MTISECFGIALASKAGPLAVLFDDGRLTNLHFS
jgi:hypothetical protein